MRLGLIFGLIILLAAAAIIIDEAMFGDILLGYNAIQLNGYIIGAMLGIIGIICVSGGRKRY